MITLNPFKLLDRSREPAAVAGPQRDPFAAVPVRNERAEHREDSNGCYQIRMRLDRRATWGARLAHRLGLHRDVRVNLDRHGSFFWAQVDGRRNLEKIEKRVRCRFGLPPDESRRATLEFTKMLMLRHLVHLEISQPDGEDTDND